MKTTHLPAADGTINTVAAADPETQAEAVATASGFLLSLSAGCRLREALVRIVQREDGTWAVFAHVNRLPELRAVATTPARPTSE